MQKIMASKNEFFHVSRLVDITGGSDFLGLCDQKSLYKHVSDFGRLRSYGHFLIPVHTFVWTASNQLAGDVLNLVAYRLRCKHYFCHLTRPRIYRQSSFRISTLGRYLRNVGGWVFAWSVCTAWLNYYYVFKNPDHLHYSDCAATWCYEQFIHSFIYLVFQRSTEVDIEFVRYKQYIMQKELLQ